uniref:tumor necrosis factor receptor superfamily member 13B n=1 Tax=Epinephelus lanceolatus TaxID=310571 RepID=UPI001445633F|nr:tumor necrosis factor receptor superfamily member 13B [Epinephelus lanceolatus]
MGGSCREGQFWDNLVRRCIGCQTICKDERVDPKCTSYCESAHCKARPGHYYDGLLKKCVKCDEVCGGPPAECSQHCQKIFLPSIPQAPQVPVTTKKLSVEVMSYMPNSRGTFVPTTLEDSTILLYSLLGLCMVLLFSSLSLALVVFVRKTKAKTSNSGPREANHNQESVVQMGQEVGRPGQSSTDFITNSYRTTDRKPSYDSSPTETCICVHCFPDLKALGQGNDRPPRAPYTFYQQPAIHKAQFQNGGPVWTEENLYTSGMEMQEEPALG